LVTFPPFKQSRRVLKKAGNWEDPRQIASARKPFFLMPLRQGPYWTPCAPFFTPQDHRLWFSSGRVPRDRIQRPCGHRAVKHETCTLRLPFLFPAASGKPCLSFVGGTLFFQSFETVCSPPLVAPFCISGPVLVPKNGFQASQHAHFPAAVVSLIPFAPPGRLQRLLLSPFPKGLGFFFRVPRPAHHLASWVVLTHKFPGCFYRWPLRWPYIPVAKMPGLFFAGCGYPIPSHFFPQ